MRLFLTPQISHQQVDAGSCCQTLFGLRTARQGGDKFQIAQY